MKKLKSTSNEVIYGNFTDSYMQRNEPIFLVCSPEGDGAEVKSL